MKKNLALLLALVMLVSVFMTACGGEGAAEPQQGAAVNNESAGGTISFWNIATDEPDKTVWFWGVDQYNATLAAETGYTIDAVATVNDQYKEKLAVAMGAGQCPDMYIHWTGGSLVEYAKSGYAQDLTELIDKYGLRDVYTEASLAQASVDGKIYALPVKSNTVAAFYYDKAMWAEKGYEVPTTLDELEALCDKMVADGITPFALANQPAWTGSMYYMYLVARHGGPEIISAAYDGTGSLVNESTIFAGQKIQEWVQKGYFPEGVNSLSPDNGDDRALLYQGAGMMLHGSWQIGSIASENPEFYENLGAFTFPIIPESSADQTAFVGTLGDNFISFNCTGEKLEAAFQIALMYTSDEWLALATKHGNVPPLRAASSDDPVWQTLLNSLASASAVQLWWDQYLPPAVADVHKSSSQKCFDCSATPEAIAQEQQDAMAEWLAQNG